VSSDADFTPLVMHLREKGAAVYGFGDARTPEPLVSACSRFVRIDRLVAAVEAEQDEQSKPPKRPTANELKGDTGLVNLLRKAVRAAADESGWATVHASRQHIGNQSSFDPRNYGHPTMSSLLKATELFEMRAEGQPGVSVRDKRLARN
jgi:uncharacterized LabA/DUF88 family protein